MKKYKDSLILSIKRQLETWLDSAELVANEDVYRFIHSLKGTAATIGLNDLSEIAEIVMTQLTEHNYEEWDAEQLRQLLFMFIKYSYEYEINQEADWVDEENKQLEHDTDKPVILILDDDITLLMFLKEELEKQGWGVLTTNDPDKAITYFYELQLDCFVTDLHIPFNNGFLVIDTVRKHNNKQTVPIIVISVDSEKETRLKAYRMGADDFLTKPLEMEELIVRMRRQLNRKKTLDKLLFLDELTGAFNRKYLRGIFERQRTELMRTKQIFCIAMLDLDYFKRVNDQYGHLVGDHVLASFASLMKQKMRGTDILFRYGGEEFAMILPNTRKKEAKLVLERLLSEFSQLCFDGKGDSFHVTFSAGIVEVTGVEETCDQWLKLADQTLYEAKTLGRNRIETAKLSTSLSYKRVLKIAILDDDAIIRTMLSESLKHIGSENMEVEIRSFRDGEEFFQDPWHSGNEPYVVVLDGIMPRMDGMEVLERLRSMPSSKQYTIVMLTGQKSQQDIAKALHMGVDDYITKPFSIEELQLRIKRLIQQRIH